MLLLQKKQGQKGCGKTQYLSDYSIFSMQHQALGAGRY